MDKIIQLMNDLKERYGTPALKDGQSMGAISAAYRSTLSAYSAKDIKAAGQSWMQTSKFPRWPEPAELVVILRDFGAEPERQATEHTPIHVKQAQADAGIWYNNLMKSKLPDGAWPFTWDMAVQHVIGAAEPKNRGNTFLFTLTRAWLDGVIPSGFDRKAAAYFAEMQERKAKYWEAVRQHGHVAVNERRVQW